MIKVKSLFEGVVRSGTCFCLMESKHTWDGVAFNYQLICEMDFFVCLFLGPHPWHMEVPRVSVESELQLLAYATATATSDPSRVCDLHHSSRQRGDP